MGKQYPAIARYAALGLLSGWIGCAGGPRIDPQELLALDGTVAIYASTLPDDLEPAWEVKLRSPPAILSLLGSKTLLISSHRGEVYRLGLEAGKRDGRVWRPLKKAITAQLVSGSESMLYIASAEGEILRAFDMGTGATRWTRDVEGITGKLVATGGLLLAASLAGEVAAYDTDSGRLVWREQLPGRNYQGVAVVDSLAIVLDHHGSLYGFPLTGSHDSAPTESPLNTEAPASNPYRWRQQLDVSPNSVVATGLGQLFIADTDGQVLKVDPATGTILYRLHLDAPIYSPPLVVDSLVIVATSAGQILGLHADDGAVIWTAQGTGLINLPPAMFQIDGTPTAKAVLVPFARGNLMALELATGRELWQYDLEKPIRLLSMTPGGALLVLPGNRLVYLDLRPAPERL